MSDLDGLRDGWCVSRDADGRWCVGQITDDCGECSGSVRHLATATYLPEALILAAAEVERRAREGEARRADYERRKAAGQLTPIERIGEMTASVFATRLMDAIEIDTLVGKPIRFDAINRRYEAAQGGHHEDRA